MRGCGMESGRRNIDMLDALCAMGEEILKSRQEEDFLTSLVQTLQRHVDCDAVILWWLEGHIHTRAVATDEGVQLIAPETGGEPLTQEAYDRWLNVSDGFFVPTCVRLNTLGPVSGNMPLASACCAASWRRWSGMG